MEPIIDPRRGDVEDDASSTERRSLLSLAGSLLVEISLPKLALAWLLRLVAPRPFAGACSARGLRLAYHGQVEAHLATGRNLAALLLAVALAAGLVRGPLTVPDRRRQLLVAELAGRRAGLRGLSRSAAALRRTAASIAGHQGPVRHAARRHGRGRRRCDLWLGPADADARLAEHRAGWAPLSDLSSLHRLAPVALANSVVLVAAYLAAAALVWGIADAAMVQPHDLDEFPSPPDQGRTWRIAHLSDIHVVGERYGFRIESGRSGPRGNERLSLALAQLAVLHAKDPLDAILITGDMTDAGRSAEWAEFLDALALHPQLAKRVLVLPGNHDLNIADRANPARLELPTSPNRRLRKLRALSVMCALQGRRVRVVDHAKGVLGESLADALEPHLAEMAKFADAGRPRVSKALADLWCRAFPMIVPPDPDDGLGIILLNSNVDTQFSFTNALGMISAEQVRGIEIATAQYPRACWIVALHHHLVEYPRAGASTLGAHRHGPDQRQLVRSSAAAPGGRSRRDARSPAYRLDRRMCGSSDRVGALSGDGASPTNSPPISTFTP